MQTTFKTTDHHVSVTVDQAVHLLDSLERGWVDPKAAAEARVLKAALAKFVEASRV